MDPLAARGANALSGLVGTVSLGDRRRIYESNRIVMQVRVRDSDGRDLPGGTVQYLLAATASRYANSTWSPDALPDVSDRPDPSSELLRRAILQDISARGSILPYAPAAYPVLRVSSTVGPAGMSADGTASLSGQPQTPHIRYRAWSWPEPLDEAQRAFLAARRGRTSLPRTSASAVSPRVRQLAREWCSDLLAERDAEPDPARRDRLEIAIARRLSDRLSEAYAYTLDLEDADPRRDGIEDFLFHMRKGHCEYFASALTVMCQSVGLRARLAMGYRADEVDPRSGELIVRDRDAHAWTQVFTPSTDFINVDPAPSSEGRDATGGWWGRLQASWSRLHFFWQENVIGYDAAYRQRLGRYLRRQAMEIGLAGRSALRRLSQSVQGLLVHGHVDAVLRQVTIALSSATAFVGAIVLLRWLRRRWRLRQAYAQGLVVPPAQLAFMRRLLKGLSARGLSPRPHQTPREVLAIAQGRFDLPSDVTDAVARFYERLRWGRKGASRSQLAEADRWVDRMMADLDR